MASLNYFLFLKSEVDFKTSITHVVGTSGDMSKPMLVRKFLIFFGTTQHCLISNFLGHLQDYSYHCYHLTLTSISALLDGWTSSIWSKYTAILIWKTQNPWAGLRGQFYDHLLDQTAAFYGCHAAEPIHVQLNLATYFIEVISN